MTKQQRANLKKLAEFLKTLPQSKFDMTYFRGDVRPDDRLVSVEYESPNECGTIGCALGWCPLVPGLEPIKDDFDTFDELSFWEYGLRILGIDNSSNEGHRTFSYLFSSNWSDIDNTPTGAAKRIETFLNTGIPKNFPAVWESTEEES